jgi:hypothetical protein
MRMQASWVAWTFILGALGGAAKAAPGGVVINEVMYHPFNESTFGRYEFIELYNDGTQQVDLSGAILTDSQDFAHICAGVRPSDNEGVFLVPANTVIGAGTFLTLWHTPITGVTDQPGNVVYNHFQYLGNVVLANGGDQVTLLRCSGGSPAVIDTLDYGTLGLGVSASNVSIERITPGRPTQDGTNWGFSTAPTGTQDPNSGYTKGGTPGALNSIAVVGCIDEWTYVMNHLLPDVLFMSESDRPLDVVSFEGAGGSPPTAQSVLALVGAPQGYTAEERDPANFYRALELSGPNANPNAPNAIHGDFDSMLTDVIYVAVFAPQGSPDYPIVNVYLVGRTACGDLVGIHSISIET